MKCDMSSFIRIVFTVFFLLSFFPVASYGFDQEDVAVSLSELLELYNLEPNKRAGLLKSEGYQIDDATGLLVEGYVKEFEGGTMTAKNILFSGKKLVVRFTDTQGNARALVVKLRSDFDIIDSVDPAYEQTFPVSTDEKSFALVIGTSPTAATITLEELESDSRREEGLVAVVKAMCNCMRLQHIDKDPAGAEKCRAGVMVTHRLHMPDFLSNPEKTEALTSELCPDALKAAKAAM